ncbi:MAG: carbohydrate ABC transporter permease [Candidatus Sericytochromatia bacterium]|nr:carbohydrate ABC transporter permease [Candidatus Sericytochromatia bacterium]
MGTLRKLDLLTYLLLILGSIAMVLPFILMCALALSPNDKVLSYPPLLFPTSITSKNFNDVMAAGSFFRYFVNSLLISSITTAGQMVTCSMAGYAFARLEFKAKNAIFFVFLSTMMIPTQVNLVPLFSLMQKLGWVNTYFALIIPGLFSAFGIFLMRQYYLTLPKELEDSGKIDGCTHWGIFWRIFFPLSVPSLAALGIFSFITSWNSFLWPLLVTNSETLRTLPVGLAAFKSSFREITNWSLLMAGTLISVVPAIIVFITGQKYFISGITSGSVKG